MLRLFAQLTSSKGSIREVTGFQGQTYSERLQYIYLSLATLKFFMKIAIYVVISISFQTFSVKTFKIVVDS